jgi:hypothetical protein
MFLHCLKWSALILLMILRKQKEVHRLSMFIKIGIGHRTHAGSPDVVFVSWLTFSGNLVSAVTCPGASSELYV